MERSFHAAVAPLAYLARRAWQDLGLECIVTEGAEIWDPAKNNHLLNGRQLYKKPGISDI